MIAAAETVGSLAALTHSRWALPVLAHVIRQRGCKFVTLSRQLRIPPSSLKRTLTRLDGLELVVRNPGHGHPMRPEYILGPLGERAGELPRAILDWITAENLDATMLKKWSLPVLVALDPAPSRFSEVRRTLSTASPRAVALALKDHTALGLVSRRVEDRYPPAPLYALMPRALPGREPARLLGVLLAAG